jgi:prepilin-type processing-associated H-X9-DG protein
LDVWGPYLEKNQAVLQCPSDTDRRWWDEVNEEYVYREAYWKTEGQSYEYRAFRLAGETRRKLARDRKLSDILIMFDYRNFHGPAEVIGSRNALFADAHAEPF